MPDVPQQRRFHEGLGLPQAEIPVPLAEPQPGQIGPEGHGD